MKGEKTWWKSLVEECFVVFSEHVCWPFKEKGLKSVMLNILQWTQTGFRVYCVCVCICVQLHVWWTVQLPGREAETECCHHHPLPHHPRQVSCSSTPAADFKKKTQRCTFHYNSKYFSGTSLWWSTTWVCWITSPTSSAVCTVCQVPTVWSLCRSASEKVSPFGPDVNLRCRLLRRRRWSSNQFMYQRFIPGINIFLDGYVPTENLRFRETSLVFKVAETANEEEVKRLRHYQVSDLLHLLLSPVLPVPHSVCSFPPVPWHVQDDGRVHTGDQGWRIHRLWDHGDAGRERYVFCLTSTLPTVC